MEGGVIVTKLIGHGTFGNTYSVEADATGASLVLKVASMGRAARREGDAVVVASGTATVEAEAFAALGAETPVDEHTDLDAYVAHAVLPLVPRFVSAHALHSDAGAGGVWLGIVSETFGRSLHDILAHECGDAWARALEHDDVRRCLAWQLLDLVRKLHARGYLHRDIKPANCLVEVATTGFPLVRLCDLGSVKVLRAGDPAVPSTPFICTRPYRAPELLCGSTAAGGAADTWSLACTIAELWLATTGAGTEALRRRGDGCCDTADDDDDEPGRGDGGPSSSSSTRSPALPTPGYRYAGLARAGAPAERPPRRLLRDSDDDDNDDEDVVGRRGNDEDGDDGACHSGHAGSASRSNALSAAAESAVPYNAGDSCAELRARLPLAVRAALPPWAPARPSAGGPPVRAPGGPVGWGGGGGGTNGSSVVCDDCDDGGCSACPCVVAQPRAAAAAARGSRLPPPLQPPPPRFAPLPPADRLPSAPRGRAPQPPYLFAGATSDGHQLLQLINVLGTPTAADVAAMALPPACAWELRTLVDVVGRRAAAAAPEAAGVPPLHVPAFLRQRGVPMDIATMLAAMLRWDPTARLPLDEAMDDAALVGAAALSSARLAELRALFHG